MKYIEKIKAISFVLFLIINPSSVYSQETKLHFFDLSKECNLDVIIAQLKEDGFKEEEEQRISNIPNVCYTKSGEGQYVRFNCNYTPKTKQVASYWYRIYTDNTANVFNELKLQYGEPNSGIEYHAPNFFEWHNPSADIKLKIGDDKWLEYSYEDKAKNQQLLREIGREISSGELYTIIYIVCLCLLGLLVAYIYYIKGKNKRKQSELNRIKRNEKQHQIDALYEAFKTELTNQYDSPTRTVDILISNDDGTNLHGDILVFQHYKKLIIGKKKYDFQDILNCFYYDENERNVTINQTTKTKTGSLLGRAAIGALTFGAAGAVVGAVTANKESTSTVDSSHIGSFIVKIGIKSLEEPTITLRFGNDKSKAEEVYALIQAIIAMK